MKIIALQEINAELLLRIVKFKL